MAISDFAAREYGRMTFWGQANSCPATWYVGLAIATITSNLTGATVSEPAGGYTRQGPIPSTSSYWLNPSSTDHTFKNANDITFTNTSGSAWTITGTFLVSASSNGSIWHFQNFASSRVIAAGESYQFNANDYRTILN
jgi:hypothetical protein